LRLEGSQLRADGRDLVAVEEPLEIQIGYRDGVRRTRTLSITLRTPGHDRELAAGFAFAEGIVQTVAQISTILERRNKVRVELRSDVKVDWPALERHIVTNSSCGFCGKTCIDTAQQRVDPLADGPVIAAATLARLPQTLNAAQPAFELTGGLHAAALFRATGQLVSVYEDVGRHNALDKLVGAELLAGRLPLRESILLVSGRAGFELVLKALVAGIPIFAAIGAPTSLAVDLAREGGMTLAGFVRGGRFNLYSCPNRVGGGL